MKYCISIEETVVGSFEVEAKSKEEALEIAKEKYDNCEFVNEPGDLVEKKIAARVDGEDFSGWEEF
jgi:hypothetical protein